MRIVCVAGGSYKSFYLNCFLKLKKCNILVFNYGIIYNICTNESFIAVAKELSALSNALHCVVVAGVFEKKFNSTIKRVMLCRGNKVELKNVKIGAKFVFKNKSFIVGDEFTDYKNKNKIILCNKQIKPILKHCSKRKIYVFCDNYGVNLVQNRKLSRKFCKYSKFILK